MAYYRRRRGYYRRRGKNVLKKTKWQALSLIDNQKDKKIKTSVGTSLEPIIEAIMFENPYTNFHIFQP